MMIMSSEQNQKTKVITLEPFGHVSADNVQAVQEQLTNALTTTDYQVIVVDMKRVEFMDSAGLMALVSSFRQAQSLGRRFVICSLAPAVRMVFELTQLDCVFEIVESVDALDVVAA